MIYCQQTIMSTRKPFITEDFLLQNPQAVELYHRYAAPMPIIDYHSHLPPQQIAADHRFENLTQIWLYGDHYKWRAMRAAGVPERYCTGDASDWEKFAKWAETVPQTLRNPLYHWTHLELHRFFDVCDCLLSPETAKTIWDICNQRLQQPELSARGILRQMNVVLVCTTDDPTDTLEHHKAIAAEAGFATKVLPTFRPDRAMAFGSVQAFNDWIERLEQAADMAIGDDFQRFVEALRRRHDYFHSAGCRLSDHGIETFYAADYSAGEVASAFARLRRGEQPDAETLLKFRSALLYEFAVMDWEKQWTQQFHVGPLRNNNTRMYELLGPDTGFDSIGECEIARPMAKFLDRLELQQKLTKTIVYNINPAQNEVVATMLGNFQDGSTPGKMQYGAAWWFLDQKEGIERQLDALSSHGLLARFVGMLTDSRSFLSYVRHEYFRRILCNLLGSEMQQGLLPDDMQLIGSMVQDICYRNAARYFGFHVPAA
jgi:glucuronate isomerase